MKIFDYAFNVGTYSGGVMLIAAKNKEAADEVMKKEGGDGWGFLLERKDMKHVGPKGDPIILVNLSYDA